MKNISNHIGQIYDVHCLCNILVVKIPKVKVCNPSPFRKTCFVTSLMKQCHVLFEITFHVFFCWTTFAVHFSGSLMEPNRPK